MTQLSEEQLQQIVETPAGERVRMRCGAADLRSVITDALSLLDSDSQAADKSAHELAVEWSQSTSDDGISVDDINRLAQLIDQRTTAMRDKCVEKVKALRPMNGQFEYNRNVEPWKSVFDFYYKVLAELESLTP